jgi:hypothetical protein
MIMTNNNTKLDIEALERLIIKCYEQDGIINEMQSVQNALVDAYKKLNVKVSGVLERLQTAESEIARLSAGITDVSNKTNELVLDSGGDHQLQVHRAGVVADWRAEFNANLNSDEIPFAGSEIMFGVENAKQIRKKREAQRNNYH